MKVITGDFGKKLEETTKEEERPTARKALEFMLSLPEIDEMEDAIIYLGSREYSTISSTMTPPETYVMLDLLKMSVLEQPDEF